MRSKVTERGQSTAWSRIEKRRFRTGLLATPGEKAPHDTRCQADRDQANRHPTVVRPASRAEYSHNISRRADSA